MFNKTKTDLSEEYVEELRMNTNFKRNEILSYRRSFLMHLVKFQQKQALKQVQQEEERGSESGGGKDGDGNKDDGDGKDGKDGRDDGAFFGDKNKKKGDVLHDDKKQKQGGTDDKDDDDNGSQKGSDDTASVKSDKSNKSSDGDSSTEKDADKELEKATAEDATDDDDKPAVPKLPLGSNSNNNNNNNNNSNNSSNNSKQTAKVSPELTHSLSTLPIEECPMEITLAQFLSIKSVSMNPLKLRIASCFDFIVHPTPDYESKIDFSVYMQHASTFNRTGNREAKLKFAFRIQDFDNDGVISKNDLKEYYNAIAKNASIEVNIAKKDRNEIINTIMSEISSDPKKKVLSQEDFSGLLGTTDFDNNLKIDLLSV
jgi:Ca2+-binding EF-hand superfamily protein